MPQLTRASRPALAIAAPLACLVAILCPHGAPAAPPSVYAFPIPGSRVASPMTQIVFRGLPIAQLGTIIVTGSRSGPHTGTMAGDSDGNGGSFLPTKPFTPGEVVTVGTGLNVVGGANGTFRFTVAIPASGNPSSHWPAAPRARNDVMRFHSRPDLEPPKVSVTARGAAAPGDIFVGPQFGPVQDGPMIVDSSGNLVWFKSLPGNASPADFRVQTYRGQPVLTWWQGYVNGGNGVGVDVIDDSSYNQIAVIHGVDGLSADLHEFQITPHNTALIATIFPVRWDSSAVHLPRNQIVYESVVQEVDIPTGLLLFQWDSLDHVPITDTDAPLPTGKGNRFDYFHLNSIDVDRDGNLLISGRDTSAVYKIDHNTGRVIWTLGGKHSSFKLSSAAAFAFQHDVRVRSTGDRYLTVFDDGAGPPVVHSQSRALKLLLDLGHMTARVVSQHQHAPPLLATFEGNYQQLAGGDDFIGWGSEPYFSEYNSRGQLVMDGHFNDLNASYRSYRFVWNGTPTTSPAITADRKGTSTVVFASWNGATQVASWRVLGGSSPSSLQPVKAAAKHGFETAISVGVQPFVAVQAIDVHGSTLGTSAAVRGQ